MFISTSSLANSVEWSESSRQTFGAIVIDAASFTIVLIGLALSSYTSVSVGLEGG